MKLDIHPVNISKSGDFTSEQFSIGNTALIIEILRSKMYPDPIRAICQEVISNSRDANREAGRENIPVIVEMPNDFDDNIRFIDNGIGITPDRMSNVFLQYGVSTKRDDDIQTGGFGLGAKTPFSYVDTFTITTVTDEGSGRTRRTYIAYIDESKCGAMSLVMSEDVSNEVNTGTTIALAVKKGDEQAFIRNTQEICNFWEVRPEIRNCAHFAWQDDSIVVEDKVNKLWKLASSGRPLAIIDGIPYRINNTLVVNQNKVEKSDVAKILRQPIRLFFQVGELSVTANRTDLEYNEKVIKKICSAADMACEDIRKTLNANLANSTNLWEASCSWGLMSSKYRDFAISPTWNGLPLIKALDASYDHVTHTLWSDYVEITCFEYDSIAQKVSVMKHYRNIRRVIPVDESYLLIEDDIADERTNKRRLKTAFESTGYTLIGVVRFADQKGRDYFETRYNWSHCSPTKLSTFEKASNPTISRKGKITYHKVKTINATSTSCAWIPKDSRTAEDNLGGVYVIIHSGKNRYFERSLSNGEIASLQEFFGIKIYGILYKWSKNINGAWKPLETFLLEEVKRRAENPLLKSAHTYGRQGFAQDFFSSTRYAALSKLTWKRPNLLSEWIRLSLLAKQSVDLYDSWNRLYSIIAVGKTFGVKEWSTPNAVGRREQLKMHKILESIKGVPYNGAIKKMEKIFQKKYPLISSSSSGSGYYRNQEDVKKFAQEAKIYIEAKESL